MTKERIKRSSRINCYVLPDIKDKLEFIAQKQGRSFTNVIEMLIKKEHEFYEADKG